MPKAYWWHKRTNCCLVKSLPKLGASCTGSSQSSGLDRVGADHQQVAVCHLFRMMETTSTLSTQLPEVSKDIVSMSWSSKPCRLIVGIMPWGFSCSPVGVFTTSLQSPRSTNHSPKSSCVVKSGLQRYVPLWEDETSLSKVSARSMLSTCATIVRESCTRRSSCSSQGASALNIGSALGQIFRSGNG
jgi:hypothetical protein